VPSRPALALAKIAEAALAVAKPFAGHNCAAASGERRASALVSEELAETQASAKNVAPNISEGTSPARCHTKRGTALATTV